MEYVIETRSLTKRFPSKIAVNKVNLHVEKGAIYGLIGKNGAGKTTAMKMILGIIEPSGGEITLFGSKDLAAERRRIGFAVDREAHDLGARVPQRLQLPRRNFDVARRHVEHRLHRNRRVAPHRDRAHHDPAAAAPRHGFVSGVFRAEAGFR